MGDLARIKADLAEVTGRAYEALDGLLRRGESLDELDARSATMVRMSRELRMKAWRMRLTAGTLLWSVLYGIYWGAVGVAWGVRRSGDLFWFCLEGDPG